MSRTWLQVVVAVALTAPLSRAQDALPHEEAAAAQVPARVRTLLREAPALELFAIICERDPDPGEPSVGDPALEDAYPIRRRVEVGDPERRRQALAALYEGIAQPDPPAMCFEPHHALRATRGQEQVTLLICYSCAQVQVREAGREAYTLGIGHPGEAALNRLLGQETTVAPDLLSGRPVAYWLERLKDETTREDAQDALRDALTYDGADELVVDTGEVAARPEWRVPLLGDAGAREAVAMAMGADARLAATSIGELVQAATGDPSPQVRAAAERPLLALVEDPREEAISHLLDQALGEGEPTGARVRALELLAGLGPNAADVTEDLERLAAEAEAAARIGAAARQALERLRRE